MEQGLPPKSQYGFRRHRRTTDMIFATRQLQEKCKEMRHVLHLNTKLKTYDADIPSTLLYGAAPWTVYLKQTQPLQPQLPSPNTEDEVAEPDTRHGLTGADASPQQLRYADTTATTLERPPRANE
nr:unnamed protein product [Spirometra erinaceieuropaei]